jgi:hypothetical protein
MGGNLLIYPCFLAISFKYLFIKAVLVFLIVQKQWICIDVPVEKKEYK